MTFPSMGFTELAYQEYSGGPRYYKSDYPEYYDSNLVPPLTLGARLYLSQVGIYKEGICKERDSAVELPRCEYCGRRQAKKDEPLCPGCGNVV